jgi:hypothetical protein
MNIEVKLIVKAHIEGSVIVIDKVLIEDSSGERRSVQNVDSSNVGDFHYVGWVDDLGVFHLDGGDLPTPEDTLLVNSRLAVSTDIL